VMFGTYVGPLKSLQGEKAMLRTDDGGPGMVLAQFNNTALHHPTNVELRPELYNPSHGKAMLGYGWHPFRTSDFKVEAGE
jgi:hypothetical protein